MIVEKNLNSWNELQEEIANLSSSLGENADSLLFRGHSESEWKLDSTMERNTTSAVSLSKYYFFAHSAKTKIETFTESNWDIPTPPEYLEWLQAKDALSFNPFPGYEYLAYLRHHGFPSPFLDWSASPYIAQFFAFNSCTENANGHVSIFCFLERSNTWKTWSGGEPGVHVFGPYARVHRRHILQQSQYSICIEYNDENNVFYANHHIVFDKSKEGQDTLWKFNVPKSERRVALKSLNKMNINSYSLFGTEDSLMETIATSEIIDGKF